MKRDVRCHHPRRGRPEQSCFQLLFRYARDGVEIKCPSCKSVQVVPFSRMLDGALAASTGGF